MKWLLFQPGMTAEHLGIIPAMLDEGDPRPAAEQFHANYAHGGGWRPTRGFALSAEWVLSYPGDPPMRPVAMTQLREEFIMLYPHAWVLVLQPGGSWAVCRMD
jgi:hypothetical protein